MSYCTNCGKEKNDEDKYCPKCGNAKRNIMNKVIKFGNWLSEPVPLTAEGARSLAELERAKAELERAKQGTRESEPHTHQHIHIYGLNEEEKKLIKNRELKLIKEYDN
jgi:uncharacterized membrane protein YvbJ